MVIKKVKIVSFIFTCLVSIDLIQVGGLRLSLIPMFLYGLYILIKKKSIEKDVIFIAVFSMSCLPSLLFSEDFYKSLGYIIWISFNFIAIAISYSEIMRKDIESTMNGIMLSYRIQIVIAVILYFLGIQARAHLLYYEPSYFALALTPYIVIVIGSFYKKNDKSLSMVMKYDLVLIALALLVTKSANLMFVIGIALLVIGMSGKGKFKKVIVSAIIVLIFVLLLYIYAQYSNDLLAQTVKNIFAAKDVFTTAMERTGNRWYRAELTYDVAMHHFWGVGIGAFSTYTQTHNLPKYSSLPDYLSPIGNQPINLYFEIISTCGWLAFVVWMLYHFHLLRRFKKYGDQKYLFIPQSLIVAMLALNIESNFMRPYYWMLLGLTMAIGTNRRKHNENT